MESRLLNSKKSGLWHGGDYNPEQWPREVWTEDSRLMEKARFSVCTVGVFSWASYEPEEGRYTWSWLDDVFDMAADAGRHIVLATPSAAMPAWLSKRHPEVLRAGRDGVRRKHGNRVNFCLTSPEYRRRTRGISERLAERYGSHPALLLWHVSNEYGGECCCENCQAAFQAWLKVKYSSDLDELNRRWWTRFWSHTYSDWEQIEIPGPPYGEEAVLGQVLDWKRFVSDQTINFMANEMEPLRRLTPDVPITTNMMGFYDQIDYPKMAKLLDLVSWDSYPNFGGLPLQESNWQGVAMVHDAYRAMKKDRSFLLIESTPSTSNWYPIMRVKAPGVHQYEMVQAIAHGADGAMYFQWRQSKGSAEMYHGAVVTHAGAEGVRVFEEVCQAGRALESMDEVAGAETPAKAAVILDWEVQWAHQVLRMPILDGFPYVHHCQIWHSGFWKNSIPVDVVDQTADLSDYRVVVLPAAILLRPGFADKVSQFVREGGILIASCLTGHVDHDLLAYAGGAPGPLAEVLGLHVHEVDALHSSEEAWITWEGSESRAASVCELPALKGAEAIGFYSGRFYEGTAAITQHQYGRGKAYWVGADAAASCFESLILRACREAEVAQVMEGLPKGVTAHLRRNDGADYIFVMNATNSEKRFSPPANGELLNDAEGMEAGVLKPHGVKVFVCSSRLAPTGGRP